MNSAANETFSDFNINLNGGLDGGGGALGGEDSGSDGVESREDRENLLRCIYVLQVCETDPIVFVGDTIVFFLFSLQSL